MMLVEHEAFPTEFFRQLDLLQYLPIINVVGRIELRIIGGQNIDVETHSITLEASWLNLCDDFFRHPFHALQAFCDGRSSNVEDHSVCAHSAVVQNFVCDLLCIAEEAPAFPRRGLLFAIEERTF